MVVRVPGVLSSGVTVPIVGTMRRRCRATTPEAWAGLSAELAAVVVSVSRAVGAVGSALA